MKDSDNDGLPDFYEEELPCFNGKVFKSDKNNADTDGDGLLDNASIKRGNSIIAPKDNDCLKYNGIYNMWKKHIYEMVHIS